MKDKERELRKTKKESYERQRKRVMKDKEREL